MGISSYALKRKLLKIARDKKLPKHIIKNIYKIKFPKCISILGTSTKVEKNIKFKSLTGVIYLSPSSESLLYGGGNLCPSATKVCSNICLGKTSGALKWNMNSKLWKTLLFIHMPQIFFKILERDICMLENKANKLGLNPSIRLNGTSDIAWEIIRPQIFDRFKKVIFYDYTKIYIRYKKFLNGNFPNNYYLTFSRSETNEKECIDILNNNGSCAAIFSDLPNAIESGYLGFPVCNGDSHDFRVIDNPGHWIGLSVKGYQKDNTGFIINNT